MLDVSVVVPTKNSATTLARCLESVRSQSGVNLDVIVVDSRSEDGTQDIASRHGRVIEFDSGMTKARLVGTLAAKGQFVLNLDSDQILGKNAVQLALETSRSVVAFGEISSGRGVVANLNRIDNRFVNLNWRQNLDVTTGAIRPRLYVRERLKLALESIPQTLLDLRPCPFSEDSLIFFHSGFDSRDVGFVPDAILHLEESGLVRYLRKWHDYGCAARAYRGTEYRRFAEMRGARRGAGKFLTLPALMLRGVPFLLGYHS
jgi:glycosyltransferase involved in cell wall biosynthesis